MNYSLAKQILDRSERIEYNPNWTLLEQNQIHQAAELARDVLKGCLPSITRNCMTCEKDTEYEFLHGDKWNDTYKCTICGQIRCCKS